MTQIVLQQTSNSARDCTLELRADDLKSSVTGLADKMTRVNVVRRKILMLSGLVPPSQ